MEGRGAKQQGYSKRRERKSCGSEEEINDNWEGEEKATPLASHRTQARLGREKFQSGKKKKKRKGGQQMPVNAGWQESPGRSEQVALKKGKSFGVPS